MQSEFFMLNVLLALGHSKMKAPAISLDSIFHALQHDNLN